MKFIDLLEVNTSSPGQRCKIMYTDHAKALKTTTTKKAKKQNASVLSLLWNWDFCHSLGIQSTYSE